MLDIWNRIDARPRNRKLDSKARLLLLLLRQIGQSHPFRSIKRAKPQWQSIFRLNRWNSLWKFKIGLDSTMCSFSFHITTLCSNRIKRLDDGWWIRKQSYWRPLLKILQENMIHNSYYFYSFLQKNYYWTFQWQLNHSTYICSLPLSPST